MIDQTPAYLEEKMPHESALVDFCFGRRPSFTISFQILAIPSETYQNSVMQQSETEKLYEISKAQKIKELISQEEKFFANTYQEEISQEARRTLSYVVEKLAELNFKKLSVEFTLLNTVIFFISLKHDVTLLMTVPLTKHEKLDDMEVIYNLFIEEEEVVSDCKKLFEVVEGAKELTNQGIEFTTG